MPDISVPSAVVGVIIGAVLTQIGAWFTAGRTLRAQRQIARDTALRDYRKSRVLSALDAIDEESTILGRLSYFRKEKDWDELQNNVNQMVDFSRKRTASLIVPVHDIGFTNAWIDLQSVQINFIDLWTNLIKDARARRNAGEDVSILEKSEELSQTEVQLLAALRNIHLAAEHYIFDLNNIQLDRRSWRHALGKR